MGMEIDSLEIAIQAQAQSASRQIDNLYSKLGTLAKALNGTTGGYRKTATEIGRVTAAVRALANTRIPNFERIVTQVSSLSTAINGLQGMILRRLVKKVLGRHGIPSYRTKNEGEN